MNFQLVIPVAGPNDDFKKYKTHKLLITIEKKKSIEWIQSSRPYKLSDGIFIFQKEHIQKYNLKNKIEKIFNKKIKHLILNKYTAGAPQTVLEAKHLIDPNKPLVIDLLDQYLDLKKFMNFCKNSKNDGCVPLFSSLYHDRGYAIIDKANNIKKVSEKDKKPISLNSTACVNYFRKGKFFFDYAHIMIKRNKKSADKKFMISLVYNEMIKKKLKVKGYDCEFIASLGSVKSIEAFYESCRLVKY